MIVDPNPVQSRVHTSRTNNERRTSLSMRTFILASLCLFVTLPAAMIAQDNADSDSDGLPDAEEKTIYNTDPNNADTDGDGLTDGDEILRSLTNPRQRDSDFDTVSDNEEVNRFNTDPLKADTDGDGRSDGQEVHVDNTDPKTSDIPGVAGGGAPNGPRPVPALPRRPRVVVPCNLDSLELFYPVGASTLSVESVAENVDKLNGLLECMMRCPAMAVTVEGNASGDGASVRNQRLSDRRADLVADYLVRKGIEMRRIIRTYGLGERSPKIAEGLTRTAVQRRAAQAQNRRVVIMVTRRCE